MEQLVEDSKHVPFGRVLMDEAEFFLHTTNIRKALPDDLEKARRVTRDSSRVVIQAKEQAERTVSEAQSEAQRLISEARAHVERTTQDARTQADHTVEDARREAERIVADAQQHAEQLVADHAITQRAQQVAEEMHNAAAQDAETMRLQADNYAYEVLEKAGIVLGKLSVGIEQGKAQIRHTQTQTQNWDDSVE